jgi:hypothetical protein
MSQNANTNAINNNTTITATTSASPTAAVTNTDVINFKAGSLIDWRLAAQQRSQQRKIAAENRAKMFAAAAAEGSSSLYVRLRDGQEMIADFKDCGYEEALVDFSMDGSGSKVKRFNYTIKLLQDPTTNQKIDPPGRTVIFSCSKTVSTDIDEWISDGYNILKISRTGADKHNTSYKVRGLQRIPTTADILQQEDHVNEEKY